MRPSCVRHDCAGSSSSKAKVRFADSPPEGEPFDAQIAISSLPRAFGTRLETIPAAVPYLAAEPALREMWRERIGAEGFKIGVVVARQPRSGGRSSPLHAAHGARAARRNRGRETHFAAERLRRGTAFKPVRRRCGSRRWAPIFDAGADAFVDTAAAMTCLDLVVTCDTSIAHLAGALAVPVWVALKSDAEWRWLTERADSPWYPTMRLFRQTRRGVWSDVFEAMAGEARPACRAAHGAAHGFDAMLARRTDRQDHDPSYQGRTNRRT